jgi:Xaa-Pro aminopeptidase
MNDLIYNQRRQQFFNLLDEGIALLTSASFVTRSNDTEFPFRQESNFYYLSGITEDQCVMVFEKRKEMTKSYLFVKEVSAEESLWVGKRMGVEGASAQYSFDEVLNLDTFETKIAELLKNLPLLYCDLFESSAIVDKVKLTCKDLMHQRGVLRSPRIFSDVYAVTQKLRLIKTDDEIALIRHALAITKEAHHQAMRRTFSGINEYQVSALIAYLFADHNAEHNAYENIVAGGNRANTLHYIDNNKTLEEGTLVLIDAGCEYQMYASDITRTFPVSGTFSDAQKELYEMILHVQLEIIAMIKPGITKKVIQDASERLLCEGMVRLGILQGEVDVLIENKAHKKYYPHGIGHWLGIDVHDPCPYVDEKGEQIVFEPGIVLTIEPGIYIDENDRSVPERFRGMGIRIEDDILITSEGCENLSEGIAKSVEAIEAMCQSSL